MIIEIEPLARILLATLLSLPIGLEREISGKDAGLRTLMLLAAACAGLGWLSLEAAEGRGQGADPTRIASYTVAGIGFLGAGLIVAIRGRVHGLTTAVAAFVVMAIGLLAGMGEGPTATALALVSVLTLGPVEWLKPRTYGRFVRESAVLHVVLRDARCLAEVQKVVADADLKLQGIDLVRLDDRHVAVHLGVRGRGADLAGATRALRGMDGVLGVVSVDGSGAGAD